MTLIEEQAIELLSCAADGSFPKETRCRIDPSYPSLAAMCSVFDTSIPEDAKKLAFAAVDMADPEYGGSFTHLYEEGPDDENLAHREGMRHCFLEAAQLLREGKLSR